MFAHDDDDSDEAMSLFSRMSEKSIQDNSKIRMPNRKQKQKQKVIKTPAQFAANIEHTMNELNTNLNMWLDVYSSPKMMSKKVVRQKLKQMDMFLKAMYRKIVNRFFKFNINDAKKKRNKKSKKSRKGKKLNTKS